MSNIWLNLLDNIILINVVINVNKLFNFKNKFLLQKVIKALTLYLNNK